MSTFTTPDQFKASYDTVHATYETGQTKCLKWRKWQLKQLYWMLEDHEATFVKALQKDLHRSAFESVTFDLVAIKGELLHCLKDCERWSQGEAPKEAGFILGRLGKAWLRKEPLGVALIIGAWNFPLYTLLGPAVAAIAAGNCLVLKPSELAPACQEVLVDLIPQYLDQSAIRVCTGGAQETGHILEHKFNHIFYTGGGKVGRIVAAAAAKHLTPIVLELGGQAPAIITQSANIDLAAKRIAHAKLSNAGQICLNVNHIFADPAIHDELVERIIWWMKEFLKNGTDHLAHMISGGHFRRVTNLLEKSEGKIVYSGKNDASTNFLHPTVITDIKKSDSLMSEELFCCFLPILKSDMETAIETINSMPHPLGLYVFSTKQEEIDHVLDTTTSGGVTINDIMTHAGVPSAPFGGVGESGYGSYHGKFGFDAFSHTRTVLTMPSYLEMVMSWRYAPFKMEDRSFLEGQLPKVPFKRGEGLEDQHVGKEWTDYVGPGTITLASMATLAIGDHLTGGKIGIVQRLANAGSCLMA